MTIHDETLHGTSTCIWEALVHQNNDEDRTLKEYNHTHGTDIKNPWQRLLFQLGQTACLSGQEIGITPKGDGWHIHINACYETGKVEILIPVDRNQPVQILEDTRATSELI